MPTVRQALAAGWNPVITKKELCAVFVGERETPKGKQFTMSELKAKAQGKTNSTNSSPLSDEMTIPQALAVSWTGLEALARQKQVIIYNDKTLKRVWFGIANARVTSVGKDKDGNDIYNLVALEQPTDAQR
mgnify:CR=1 FL=1